MSKSKFKLEFTLKQHTPIIHFQGDQNGATLRATELKPKLDRFLIEHLALTEKVNKKGKDTEVPKEAFKGYFIGNGEQHLALDYKVSIVCNNSMQEPMEYQKKNREGGPLVNNRNQEPIMGTLPIFFANMGEAWRKSPKKIVYTNDDVLVIIKSFKLSLLEEIKEYFENFIFFQTFGTRQSKGLGSFTLEKINGTEIDKKIYADYVFKVDLSKSLINTQYYENTTKYYLEMEKLFDSIKRFHQVLRSGINERIYIKPFSFYYAKSKNITWDKKTFKENFLKPTTIPKQKEKYNVNNHEPLCYDANNEPAFLVRDLLGLSTEQVWGYSKVYSDYGFTIRHPKDRQGNFDYIDKKKIEPNNIKRFKTPFTYKPIKNNDGTYSVYIILDEINSKLYDESFSIIKDNNGKLDKINNMKMWKGFSLVDFFREEVYGNKEELTNRISNNNKPLAKHIISLFSSLDKVTL